MENCNRNSTLRMEDGLRRAGGHLDFNSKPFFPTSEDVEGVEETNLDEPEIPANHPGLEDAAYRRRRWDLALISKQYKQGHPIPYVEYNEEEIMVWSKVYRQLSMLSQTHACSEYIHGLDILKRNGVYKANVIPQLEDVSNFLQRHTGFKLNPAPGFLTFRDFFSGLAHKVFYCTQYLRHHSSLHFSPEPDMCHELLGHVPLLLDPKFARFLHLLGLTSLDLSDECIDQLTNVFWYTIEFGLCREDGNYKAYGGGILSSYGELEYALSSELNIRPFDLKEMIETPFEMTTYQNLYFSSESLEEAQQQIMAILSTMPRSFKVINDEVTKSVTVKDNF